MLKKKVLRAARLTEDRVRQLFGLSVSPERRERDAQRFWSKPVTKESGAWWHARDAGPFADPEGEERWRAIGRRHVDMWADFARAIQVERPVRRIVDWGCGGGANAVAFAPECSELWGVDVSAEALAQCGREVAGAAPSCAFHPVQIDVPSPESALEKIPHEVDLFVCFYVFEVFPSEEYGSRVLRIARELLRSGGTAIVQVKYATDSWATRSRRWSYSRGAASMTTYRVEQFWELAERAGLEPHGVRLVPRPAEVPDTRYAYFLLRKPST